MTHEFAQYYAASQVGTLWNELYTTGTPLNLGFSRYWGAVAEKLTGAPHLLGYELLNEPSGLCLKGPTSCLSAAQLALSNHIETDMLTPLYQAAAKAIRDAGGTETIMYEATTPPKTVDIFDEPVLGDDDQQALAYHIYCVPGDGDSLAAEIACNTLQTAYQHTYFPWLDKNPSLPGFMTEFGAIQGDASTTAGTKELKHLDNVLAMADNHLQSWAYWQLKKFQDITTANADDSLYSDDGELWLDKLKSLSRTYAQATAGPIKTMKFDNKKATFQLDFTLTVTSAPTEIYLNEELHYPNGYTVDVTPQGCFDITSPMSNYIHLNHVSGCEGAGVHVLIQPKAALQV